jgi:hypothetical protein
MQEDNMNKLFRRAVFLALLLAAPLLTPAGAGANDGIGLPPPIIFGAPPQLIVLPETYVYVVPDVNADIYFYDGWWWRPWEGRWYRSAYYDSGWAYYRRVPGFYVWIPSGWRDDYRDHRWKGHPWNYQRLPHQQVQQNWKGWKKEKHWEKEQTWGVQGLQPRSRAQKPSRNAQKPRQSGSSGEGRFERQQQHREAGPPSGKETKAKKRKAQSQQQDDHERGEGRGRR